MSKAVQTFNFGAFLEKEKLKSSGSNFTDWHRNLRILLTGCKKSYVLDKPLGDAPAEDATEDDKNVYGSRSDDYIIVRCGILQSLEADLQKRFENHGAYEMVEELKTMFQTQDRAERYEISEKFFTCKMEEHSSVSEHAIKMTCYTQRLEQLGCKIPDELKTDRVLQSLPPSYNGFVLNYNMQGMKKSIPDLFAMLKIAEVDIKKEHQVLMVNKTTSFKKGKGKKGSSKKGGKPVAALVKKPKSGPKPDTECFYCKGTGHWKRNCPKYLADKKAGNVKKGICDIHVIDVYLTSARSSAWVFDTGSVANICNSKQELRNSRRLAKDEVTMRVGNGSKVDVIAIGTLPLRLPSGLVLNLNNCYLVPALSMNIISGSCLCNNGYSFKSENNGCSIYMSNIFYGHAPIVNGLFLLNHDSSDTHVHNINAKIFKTNDDNSTYLWHCRLGSYWYKAYEETPH